jgi:hypothetical protein
LVGREAEREWEWEYGVGAGVACACVCGESRRWVRWICWTVVVVVVSAKLEFARLDFDFERVLTVEFDASTFRSILTLKSRACTCTCIGAELIFEYVFEST